MRRIVESPGGWWATLVAAALIVVVGVGGSVVFHRWWSDTIDRQNHDRLSRSVTSRVVRVENNLTRYLDALRAVGAFTQTGDVVATDAGQLDQFVHGLELEHRYTGMQAVGWQIPVIGPQVARLTQRMRQAGDRRFTISPVGSRAAYAVLVFQRTTVPVTSKAGDDRAADRALRAVLYRSRDTGQPALAASAAVAAGNPGTYLLFLPIYRSTGAGSGPEGQPTTVAARRDRLLGWMSATIDADRFLTESLAGIAPGTAGVEIFDRGQRIAVEPDSFRAGGPHTVIADLPMAGRHWQLRLAPLPGSILIQDADPAGAIGLFGGIALSLLLAAMAVMIAAQARTGQALRTANQRSADMVAMLSHDARQPLTTIINYSQFALDDWHVTMTNPRPDAVERTTGPAPGTAGPNPDDIAASLGRVIGAAHRLNNLVDDVLTTARLDAIPADNARPVAVDQIIGEAVNDSGASGMLIDTTAVQPCWAFTDPTHLRQIVANLVGNALKYGAPPVTITAHSTGQQVRIDVADAGPGVPAEFVKQLFDRFSRAATTAGGVDGSGLGLYIVQRLAQANNGQITYQPGQTAGATFTVTLPAADLDAAVPELHPASRSRT